MNKKDIPNGVILYEGPSQIDGGPIVVIANGIKEGNNRKTGQMIQTWIIRSDMHPNDALQTGYDKSVCGDCIHRGTFDGKHIRNRTCYVNLFHQGAYSVYHAYKRGSYPNIDLCYLNLLKGRHMRIGSYGDPASVPLYVWEVLAKVVSDYTGYTHQWETCDSGYQKFCMASIETFKGYKLAKSMGWRTFRVKQVENSPILKSEITCPAQNHEIQCEKCCLCNGATKKGKDVCIIVHGSAGIPRMFQEKMAESLVP